MAGLPGRGGLPSHTMIPHAWDGRHRPTAEEAMTAEVRIRRHTGEGATFDPETGQTAFPDPVKVWQGWARVQRHRQAEQTRSVGDRQVTIRGVTVSIPVATPEVRIGDEVKVLRYRDNDSGDPHLADLSLWVHDVRYGSLLWQRDLGCETYPPTAR